MTASCTTDLAISLVVERSGALVDCAARGLNLGDREITALGSREVESGFLFSDRPTLAQPDAYSRRSPKPLWCARSDLVGRLHFSDRPGAVLSPTAGAARIR